MGPIIPPSQKHRRHSLGYQMSSAYQYLTQVEAQDGAILNCHHKAALGKNEKAG